MWQEWMSRSDEILRLTGQHLELVFYSVSIAVLIGLPVGLTISVYKKSSGAVLAIANVFQTLPSLALFGIIIPFLGIGKVPAIVVLLLYALMPIVKSAYTGMQEVDHSLLEAGRALGLKPSGILWKIQIPLAFPTIMSGVRIATVISVGTATIAAYIGAGGLGALIFRGISLSDNALILAGAIPAALLAVFIDLAMSGIEKMLRPARRSQERRKIWKKKWFRILTLSLIVISLFYALVFQGDSSGRIVVGHKHFTEQRILGSLLSQYLQKEGNKEAYPIELGGTQLNFEALANGEIDLYVEYTGTAYQSILSQKKPLNSKDQFAFVKSNLLSKYGIEIAAQLGFNNTYTLSMMPELAERLGVEKISDLKKLNGRLTLGSSSEFLDRPDGLPGIKDVYGITFGEVKLLEIGLRYEALVNGEVDLIDAYSTDGRLQKYNLRVLQDDEGFFPEYKAIVLVRPGFRRDHPDLFEALENLHNSISGTEMQKLNYQVEEQGGAIKEVAGSFLNRYFN